MPLPTASPLAFLSHKGYRGLVVFDAAGKRYCGRLLYIPDDVTFEGPTPEEAAQAFRSTVDDRVQTVGTRRTRRLPPRPVA